MQKRYLTGAVLAILVVSMGLFANSGTALAATGPIGGNLQIGAPNLVPVGGVAFNLTLTETTVPTNKFDAYGYNVVYDLATVGHTSAVQVLNAGISAAATTIVLNDASGLALTGEARIGTEFFSWTANDQGAPGTLTGVTRGTSGTVAAAHLLGDPVIWAPLFVNDVPAASLGGLTCASGDTPGPLPGAPLTAHDFVFGCLATAAPLDTLYMGPLGHMVFQSPTLPTLTFFKALIPTDAGGAVGNGGTLTDNAGTFQTSTYSCLSAGPIAAVGFASNCGPFGSPFPVPSLSTTRDMATLFFLPPPALTVVKTALTSPVVAGSADSYSLLVTNTSTTTTATNITVTDAFDNTKVAGVQLGSDANCTVPVLGPATCTFAALAPGGIHTFGPINITTLPAAGGTTAHNTASATCAGTSPFIAAPACTAGAPSNDATIVILSPAVSWAKSPTNANIWLCGEAVDGTASFAASCPQVTLTANSTTPSTGDLGDPDAPNQNTGVWQDGVIVSEILSNANDPHGLGGYQFDISYDPNVFDTPVIHDLGQMNVGGHVTTCSMSIVVPGVAHVGCVAGIPFGTGAQWIGPKTMATVRLDATEIVERTIRPNKENGEFTDIFDTNTRVTNTCGQPLNDGTIQPLPGQPECQGNPLIGVGPGGSLPDTDARFTIRRLEGDVSADCKVDVTDTQTEASKFGLSTGSLLYNKFFDVNLPLQFGDGEIDINDVQFVFGRVGSTCQAPIPTQPAIPTPS